MNGDRIFERIESLFDVQLLAPVKVFIAGCGSGGGSVALQLAMSGIRNFILLDRDLHQTVGGELRGRAVLGATVEHGALEERELAGGAVADIENEVAVAACRIAHEGAAGDLIVPHLDPAHVAAVPLQPGKIRG